METLTMHRMILPREVLIGNGVLKQVSNICKRLGFRSSATILTGFHVLDIVAKDVIKCLERDGFRTNLEIVMDSDIKNVKKVNEAFKKIKPDVVLGIGGGKVIDVAKLASSQENIPFISIPTALSHDGISSSRASIKGLTGIASVEANAPISIICDVQVISKSPYRLTASGCGDIVAKYTAVKDWKLAHEIKGEYYGEYASNLALMSAKLIMKYSKTIRERTEAGLRIVLEALISCGVAISIAGSSRPCSGSEHLFSHALNIIAPEPALHGEQCGVGSILMAYLWKADWKILKETLEMLGAPTTAVDLRIDSEYIVEALLLANKITPNKYTILNTRTLNQKSARELALVTGVI